MHLPTRRAAWCALALSCGPATAGVTVWDRQSEEGRDELRLYGRIQEDLRVADRVDPGVETRDARLRRVRAGLRLTWHDDWVLRLSGGYSDRARPGEIALEYRGWPVRIEAGRFQEPFSLAQSGSSADTLFMERPSASALAPGYGLGTALSYGGRAWGIAAGLFTREGGSDLVGDEPEQAASLRVTARPWRTRAGWWHLGASLSLREPETGAGLRLYGRDESALTEGLTPFSVRVADVDRYRLEGLETALRLGPTLLAAETLRADLPGGRHWQGHYAEAAWALTGERRGYSTRYGVIGGLHPRQPLFAGGIGAVEIALRYGTTDLTDGGGDRGRVMAVGLNWYPVERVRLTLAAQSARRELADGSRRDGEIVQARVQLAL